MNRDEAINWCIENNCDFKTGVFPPPEDWMWGESNGYLVLTTIFTVVEYEDIRPEDVVKAKANQ